MFLLVEPHLYMVLLGGWVTCFHSAGQSKCEDVGCKTGTLHCCCRIAATADVRSRLLRLRNKPNILLFVCKNAHHDREDLYLSNSKVAPLGYVRLRLPGVTEKLLCFGMGWDGIEYRVLVSPPL